MKKALVILETTLRKYNVPFKMVANVHDEWQIETSPEFANRIGIAGVDAIKQAGVFYQMRCPLDGEYKIGNNWKETH